MAAQTAESDETGSHPRVSRDTAPGNRKSAISHKRGAGKQQRNYETLVTYYGFGAFALSARKPEAGIVVGSYAQDLAGAWIEAGKADPRVQWFIDFICFGGPLTALVMLHGKMGMDLMKVYGKSPLSLFERVPNENETAASAGPTGMQDTAAPLPYMPAGPMAGTDTALPSLVPMTEDQLHIIPDVGIPSDLDVQLRHMSRQPGGRPYEELKQEAMVLLAQQAAMANGHPQAPGALGAPVMRE